MEISKHVIRELEEGRRKVGDKVSHNYLFVSPIMIHNYTIHTQYQYEKFQMIFTLQIARNQRYMWQVQFQFSHEECNNFPLGRNRSFFLVDFSGATPTTRRSLVQLLPPFCFPLLSLMFAKRHCTGSRVLYCK